MKSPDLSGDFFCWGYSCSERGADLAIQVGEGHVENLTPLEIPGVGFGFVYKTSTNLSPTTWFQVQRENQQAPLLWFQIRNTAYHDFNFKGLILKLSKLVCKTDESDQIHIENCLSCFSDRADRSSEQKD